MRILALLAWTAFSQTLNPVTDWVRETAIPISTPVAGNGFQDLMPLKKLVGDARIVALGEASHGTREFFQLKHRLFEFLAAEMSFSIIALETPMPEAYRINDFVLTGEGDPAKLARGLYGYNTQEVLDMILWMREHNKAGKGRLQFTGFDMQNPTVGLENVRKFVAKADAAYMPTVDRATAALKELMRLDSAGRKGVAKEWENVVAHLESLRPRVDGAEWAAQNARIVVQGLEMASRLETPEAGIASREASMAANVKWILDRAKGAKIVLWAHNFHVMTAPDPMGVTMMGGRLRTLYGDRMVVFGFAFNRGSFRTAQGSQSRDFTVGPLGKDSLDVTLASSGIPLFALDLRSAPKSGPVADWLAARHPTRNVMTGYSEEHPEYSVFDHELKGRYDVLLFVEKTTASRPVN